MQTLTVEHPVPFVLPPGQPIQVGLVGCGGNGSHIALSLARLAYQVRVLPEDVGLALEILADKKLMLSLLKAEEDERAQRLVEHEDVFK
mgnify:CR=1 FL=1